MEGREIRTLRIPLEWFDDPLARASFGPVEGSAHEGRDGVYMPAGSRPVAVHTDPDPNVVRVLFDSPVVYDPALVEAWSVVLTKTPNEPDKRSMCVGSLFVRKIDASGTVLYEGVRFVHAGLDDA